MIRTMSRHQTLECTYGCLLSYEHFQGRPAKVDHALTDALVCLWPNNPLPHKVDEKVSIRCPGGACYYQDLLA